jgi:signal transduction histidine kinase
MLRKLKQYVLLLLLMLGPIGLMAQGKENAKKIFILSSHTESSEWEQMMLAPIRDLAAERPVFSVSISRLQLLSHPSVESLLAQKDLALAGQATQPDLVIVLGGSCFNFAPDINQRWPGVPMLLIGEQNYYCDIEYTLFGPGDSEAKRTPVKLWLEDGLNLTLINAPAMVRRTVDMMFQMQPGLNNLIFVGGENYMSKERQQRFEKYMQQKYPGIGYKVISAANTSTDQLLETLQKESGPGTAVYFGSWLIREGYLKDITTRHNTVSLIESIVPVYTMFASDLEKHPYVMGFFSYPHQLYYHSVQDRILDILDNDIPPATMAFLHLDIGRPSINYQALTHFGLDTDNIPKDALIYNEPASFWETHRRSIMLLSFLFLVVLAAFILFAMNRSLSTMKKAKEIAEKGDSMKTAFIQNLSHEIRTPLNSIVGFSQLLSIPGVNLTNKEKQEYMSYVLNSSNMLTVMINDMLNLSNLENGKYAVSMSKTNINEVVRQAMKAIEPRVPLDVQMVFNPGIKDGASYITDGIRVQQILINFLSNACKNTRKGSITISNSLTEKPGHITISVADTGIGIPPEKADAIFERFVKLDSTKQGAGLGLSICRLMATALGGEVWLDTGYTGGARFVLSIPLE